MLYLKMYSVKESRIIFLLVQATTNFQIVASDDLDASKRLD